MAVEGSQYQLLATVPLPPLLSAHAPGVWRWESIKRCTGMEKPVSVQGRHVRSDDLAIELLQRLRRDGEERLKARITGVAVSVPPCFTDRQKAAAKLCAEAAGFGAVALVVDSKAAILDHIVRTKSRGRWLVYGLGKSAFFTTVLDGADPKHHNGTIGLGGDDFDGLLLEEFVRKNILDPFAFPAGNPALSEEILRGVEACKKQLSTHEQIDNMQGARPAGLRFQTPFQRSEFERLIYDQIKDTVATAVQTVREDSLRAEEVDGILLLGGSTRIPLVRRLLKETFPNGIITESADDSVARGAALHATTLIGSCFTRSAAPPPGQAGMPPKMVQAWQKIQKAYEEDVLDEVILHYGTFIDAAREDLSNMYQRRSFQLAEAGKKAQALEMLEKSLECWPRNSSSAKKLSEHYAREAASNLRSARSSGGKSKRDWLEKCDRDIKRSLKYDPNNPDTLKIRDHLRIAKSQRH